MDTTEINQKLDKILEFHEKQARREKIRFWINFTLIFILVVLPIILLPIVINKVIGIYSGVLNPDILQTSTEQAKNILNSIR